MRIKALLSLLSIAVFGAIGLGVDHQPTGIRELGIVGAFYLVGLLVCQHYAGQRHQAGLAVQLATARERLAAERQHLAAARAAERRAGELPYERRGGGPVAPRMPAPRLRDDDFVTPRDDCQAG